MTTKTAPQFTPDADGFYTMDEAKKLGTPGIKFRTPKGSVGTILPNRSAKGKLLAELTCIEGGPNHVREVSDWHQCAVSPEKKKGKKKSTKTTTTTTEAVTATKTPEEVVQAAEATRTALAEKLAAMRAEAGLTETQETTQEVDASRGAFTDETGAKTTEEVVEQG